MSLRHEQYNSLKRTREFLYDIMNHGTRPKTVKEFKARASSCLKHFPALKENGEPMFSHDGRECQMNPNAPRSATPEDKR